MKIIKYEFQGGTKVDVNSHMKIVYNFIEIMIKVSNEHYKLIRHFKTNAKGLKNIKM